VVPSTDVTLPLPEKSAEPESISAIFPVWGTCPENPFVAFLKTKVQIFFQKKSYSRPVFSESSPLAYNFIGSILDQTTKGFIMPTIFDKSFLDRITMAERHKLADTILARAESGSMPMHELQHLTDGLQKLIAAESEKRSAKNRRIDRIVAAKADPLMRPTIEYATGRLRALNMDINAAAATADIGAIDQSNERAQLEYRRGIALKSALAKIGVID
jgi:hypothetical protein